MDSAAAGPVVGISALRLGALGQRRLWLWSLLLMVVSAVLLYSQWQREPLHNPPAFADPGGGAINPGRQPLQPLPLTLPATAKRLMGERQSSQTAPSHALPQTQLALQLKGVFHGSDSAASGALISGAEGPGFYRLGAIIDDGVVLAKIDADSVVIERQGYPERLSLLLPDQSTVLMPLPRAAINGPGQPPANPDDASLKQQLRQWRSSSAQRP